MEFKIKITGSGTPQQLIEALNGIIEAIEEAKENSEHTNAVLDGAEWEDNILMTEIVAN